MSCKSRDVKVIMIEWNRAYTKNFSEKNIDYISPILHSIEHEVTKKLLEETSPCVFYYGVGNFELNELTEEEKTYINGKDVHFFLYEPLTYYIHNKHNRGFYTEFPSNVSSDKIKSEELESIDDICKKHNLNGHVYTCDMHIDFLRKTYHNLKLFTYDIYIRAKHDPKTILRTIPVNYNNFTKKFWCGNKRYTLARHLVMSYLANYKGNYSWNYNCSLELLKQNGCFSFDQLIYSEPELYNRLVLGSEILNSTQLSLDTHWTEKFDVNELDGTINSPVFNPDNFERVFWDKYLECFCPIVNETRFFQPSSNFSEKTLHAMFLKRPFILVAPPKTLEYVKLLGFKTFDKFWDESYDNEQDHTKRMIKIFKLIEYIDSLSITELKELYQEMNDVIKYNFEHCVEFYKNNEVL